MKKSADKIKNAGQSPVNCFVSNLNVCPRPLRKGGISLSGRTGFHRQKRYFIRGLGILLTLVIVTALLISCRNSTVCGILGIDSTDYETEAVIASVDSEGNVAGSLVEVISILTENSSELTPFSGSREAVRVYSDAILSYLLRTNYAKYTGNADSIAKASSAYPGLYVTTLISDADFDRMIYRYFGGSYAVSHTSSELFTHLDRGVDAYTTMLQPRISGGEISVVELNETKNTYRLKFNSRNTVRDQSAQYLAVFIKREDGTCYLHSLSDAA